MTTAVQQFSPSDVHALLSKNKRTIKDVSPSHITIDRLLRIALTEIKRNPDLQKCKPISVVGAIIQAAQLGLMPDSITGHSYLVPYKDKCQLIIGYKGMMTLAYQSGQVTNIFATEVYNDDMFEFEYGLDPKLKHIPNLDSIHKDNDLKCFYAIAYLQNGGSQFVVLPKSEIDRHRRYSKVSNSQYSPWATNYNEMAKKTAIRVLCKYLPQNTENMLLSNAVGLDEQADAGIPQNNELSFDIVDGDCEVQQPAPQTKSDAITDALTTRHQQEILKAEKQGVAQ